MIELVLWFLSAVILLFVVSLFVVTVAFVLVVQLRWFPGVRFRPGKPPKQRGTLLTEAEIAEAVRPLYISDEAARLALPNDILLTRAIERALAKRQQ